MGLFLFFSIQSTIFYYLTIRRSDSRTIVDRPTITGLVKKVALLLVPIAVLSSLWYVNNLLRFGTLIWTSSINLPNIDWALGVLKSIEVSQPTANIWHYITSFGFMFVDPAMMGYTMLIPLLIGPFVLREKKENYNILLLYGIISASIIFSKVVISLSSPTAGYNPRDILPLAPLLTTLSAICILSTTPNFNKKSFNAKSIIAPILLVAYFGLLNYIHSVSVWFTQLSHVTTIGELMSAFGTIIGLNLRQTSFQLLYSDRVTFVCENIVSIITLSFFAGIPILALMFLRHYKFFTRGYPIKVKLETRLKKTVLKLLTRFHSSRQWLWVKKIFTVSIMLSVIMIPRVEMLKVQGGTQDIKENQLKMNYRDIYELFASPSEFEGDILTFKSYSGLSYYLPGVKIIDLIYPANLAFLKGCFQSITPYEAVVKLRELNISYLLISPSITQHLDASLNFTLSKIIQNPEYAALSRTFGSWKLYNLGPYSVENISLPLSGWDIDSRYTNADYNLSYDGASLLLELESTGTDSRVTIVNRDLSKLNLSNYDYITADVEGSTNSRILIRFWLNDGTCFDIAYWKDPYTTSSTSFDLKPYYGKMLRGDAYIEIISSDGLNSSIKISEISFIKNKE